MPAGTYTRPVVVRNPPRSPEEALASDYAGWLRGAYPGCELVAVQTLTSSRKGTWTVERKHDERDAVRPAVPVVPGRPVPGGLGLGVVEGAPPVGWTETEPGRWKKGNE